MTTACIDISPHTSDFQFHVLSKRDELFASAMRYTRNRSDAEDLVQETFVRSLSAWASFEVGSNCRAWLFRILSNSFINGYRKKKRADHFAHQTGEEATIALFGNTVSESYNPCALLTEGELADEVQVALRSLSPGYRKIIELSDIAGMRYRDIAAQLELPMGTVMSRLFRARRLLEEQLTEHAAASYGIRRAKAA